MSDSLLKLPYDDFLKQLEESTENKCHGCGDKCIFRHVCTQPPEAGNYSGQKRVQIGMGHEDACFDKLRSLFPDSDIYRNVKLVIREKVTKGKRTTYKIILEREFDFVIVHADGTMTIVEAKATINETLFTSLAKTVKAMSFISSLLEQEDFVLVLAAATLVAVAATSDAATSDAATSDAATSDAATSDATSDAATSDAATSDAATSDATSDASVTATERRQKLREEKRRRQQEEVERNNAAAAYSINISGMNPALLTSFLVGFASNSHQYVIGTRAKYFGTFRLGITSQYYMKIMTKLGLEMKPMTPEEFHAYWAEYLSLDGCRNWIAYTVSETLKLVKSVNMIDFIREVLYFTV